MEDILMEEAKKFQEFYYELFLHIVRDFRNRTGEELKMYKEYEPEYLIDFYNNHKDNENLIDQITNITSNLILIQALPNANHRTAFIFIRIYLKKHGIYIKTYEEEQEKYDVFYNISKPLIDNDINRPQIFNEKYLDVHHSSAIKKHFMSLKKLFKSVVELPQSGMVTLESLHSFIASLNQSGSSPSENQQGSN
jgi:prophage maintenance system killer protein